MSNKERKSCETCERSCVKCSLPSSIKELLCFLAEDHCETSVTLILKTCCCNECVLEDVQIVSVLDNTVIARCHCKFMYINICCICEVKVHCDDILDELLETCSKGSCSRKR